MIGANFLLAAHAALVRMECQKGLFLREDLHAVVVVGVLAATVLFMLGSGLRAPGLGPVDLGERGRGRSPTPPAFHPLHQNIGFVVIHWRHRRSQLSAYVVLAGKPRR